MIRDLASFNESSDSEAKAWFRDQVLESNVCDEWIDAILAQRPSSSSLWTLPQLLATCESTWHNHLSASQRITMMNGHPEIGKTEATVGDPNGMEAAEQRGMAAASPELAVQIDQNKALYRERFGFIYMIFATGKSAQELAQDLQARLDNTREEELATASVEFWRINQKRIIDKLTGHLPIAFPKKYE